MTFIEIVAILGVYSVISLIFISYYLKSKISSFRIEKLNDYLNAREREFDETLKVGLKEFRGANINLHHDFIRFSRLREGIKSAFQSLDDKIKEVDGFNQNLIKTSDFYQDLHQSFKENNLKMESMISQLENLDRELKSKEEAIKQLGKIISEVSGRWEKEILTLQADFNSRFQGVEENINSEFERLENLSKIDADKLAQQYTDLEADIKDEFDNLILEEKKHLNEELSAIRSDSDTEVAALTEKITLQESRFEELLSRYQHWEKEISDHRKENQSRLDSFAEVVMTEFKNKIDDYQKEILGLLEDRYTKLNQQTLEVESRNSLKEKAVTDLYNFIEDSKKTITSQINHFSDFLEQHKHAQEEVYNNSKINLTNAFAGFKWDLNKLQEELLDLVSSKDTLQIEFKGQLDQLQDELGDLDRQQKNLIDAIEEKIQQYLDQALEEQKREEVGEIIEKKETLSAKYKELGKAIERIEREVEELEKRREEILSGLSDDFKKVREDLLKIREEKGMVFKAIEGYVEERLRETVEEGLPSLVKEIFAEEDILFGKEVKKHYEELGDGFREKLKYLVREEVEIIKEEVKIVKSRSSEEMKVLEVNLDEQKKQEVGMVDSGIKGMEKRIRELREETDKLAEHVIKIQKNREDTFLNIDNYLKDKISQAMEAESLRVLTGFFDGAVQTIPKHKKLLEKIDIFLSKKLRDSTKQYSSWLMEVLGKDPNWTAFLKKQVQLNLINKIKTERIFNQLKKTISKEYLLNELKNEIKVYKKGVEGISNDWEKIYKEIGEQKKSWEKLLGEGENKVDYLLEGIKLNLADKEQIFQEMFNEKIIEAEKKMVEVTDRIESFLVKTKSVDKIFAIQKDFDEAMVDYKKQIEILREGEKRFITFNDNLQKIEKENQYLEKIYQGLTEKENNVIGLQKQLDSLMGMTKEVQENLDTANRQSEEIGIFLNSLKEYNTDIEKIKREFGAIRELEKEFQKLRNWVKEVSDQSLINEEKTDRFLKQVADGKALQNKVLSQIKAIEDKSQALDERYDTMEYFNKKFNEFDIAVFDVEERIKAINTLKKEMAVEQENLTEIRESFNEQISIILKIFQNQKEKEGKEGGIFTELDKKFKSLPETLSRIGWTDKEIAKHLNMELYEVQLLLNRKKKKK